MPSNTSVQFLSEAVGEKGIMTNARFEDGFTCISAFLSQNKQTSAIASDLKSILLT
jgi:hypothetical protein